MVWVGTAIAGVSAIAGYRQRSDANDAAQRATAGGQLYVPTAFLPGGAYGIYGGINPASAGVASPQSMPGGNPLIGGSGYAGPVSSYAAPQQPNYMAGPTNMPAQQTVSGGNAGSNLAALQQQLAQLQATPVTGGFGPLIQRAQQVQALQQQIAAAQQAVTAGRAPGGSLGQAGGQYVVSTGGDAMQGGEVNMVAGSKPTGFGQPGGNPSIYAGGTPGFDSTGGYGYGNPAITPWTQGQPGPANPFVPVQDPSYIQYHGAPAPGGSVASPIDTTVVGSAGDLEPTRQMLRDISLSQGVDPGVAGALQSSATANLYGGNTPGMASAYLDLLRQQAQPYESRAMNQVNQNLFSRGRLGAADTVTGEAYTGLARGFSEADVARQRLALDFGSTEAQNVFGRGLAAAQTGSALQGDALQRILAASGGAQEIGRYGTLPLELALQFGVARSNAALGQASNLTAMAGQPSGGYQLANLFGGLVGSGAFAGLGGKK